MSVLFILGVYQTDRPNRWASKHRNFYYLGNALRKLGANVNYYCNRQSVKSQFLDEDHYFFEDQISLADLCRKLEVKVIVIWGGRTHADERIRKEMGNAVKFVYGEYGWFPQSGTCYFSPYGTNASARLAEEGLREHQLNGIRFKKTRNRLLRNWLGIVGQLKALPFDGVKKFDVSKPIFVPLQDEGDSNIVLSSPVKRMAEFVSFLSDRYPNQKFLVRPHPRASYESLPSLSNVEYQSASENPYKTYRKYGGVIGINSTMLMQFSLLGLPVVGVGKGIANGCGAYIECDYENMPATLESFSFEPSSAMAFFDFLLNVKQLRIEQLKDKEFVRDSYLYGLLLGVPSET